MDTVRPHIRWQAERWKYLLQRAMANPETEGHAWQTSPKVLEFFRRFADPGKFQIHFDRDLKIEGSLSQPETCAVFLHDCRFHERGIRPFLDRMLKAEDVVLDVGAGAGWYALLAAARATRGRIYAFEPVSFKRSTLEQNLALNSTASRITVERHALSNQSGVGQMQTTAAQSTPDRHREDELIRSEEVPVETLDGWMAKRSLRKVDWVRVNVNGRELDVLRGGIRTLQQRRPRLLIRINKPHLRKRDCTDMDIEAFLVKQGYKGYHLQPDGQLARLSHGLDDGMWVFEPCAVEGVG